MNTLIFDTTLTGHHLEYINYLYRAALKRDDEKFTFAVPKNEWEKVRGKCDWPYAINIRWILLDDKECHKASSGSLISKCFKTSKLIRHIAIKEKVDRIKLISIAGVIPFLPIILPNHIKLSGIIYKIYLRANKTGIKKLADYFRYLVMARSNSIDKVFILNDSRSAGKLNDIYHTDRFVSLPDPVPEIDTINCHDMRQELGITKDAKIFLHFGAMDKRKGTIEILRAINLIPKENLEKYFFIFAGRLGDNLRTEFYDLANEAKLKGANIILRDEFCSYELLHSLCKTSDAILIPYLLTNLSSGVLGYASLHHKPVIGPSDGLIGQLIGENEIGSMIDEITPEKILCAITHFKPYRINNDYAEKNSIKSFIDTILC